MFQQKNLEKWEKNNPSWGCLCIIGKSVPGIIPWHREACRVQSSATHITLISGSRNYRQGLRGCLGQTDKEVMAFVDARDNKRSHFPYYKDLFKQLINTCKVYTYVQLGKTEAILCRLHRAFIDHLHW